MRLCTLFAMALAAFACDRAQPENQVDESLARLDKIVGDFANPRAYLHGMGDPFVCTSPQCTWECKYDHCYVTEAECRVGARSTWARIKPRHLLKGDSLTVGSVCASATEETRDQTSQRHAEDFLWVLREKGVGRALFPEKPVPEWAAAIDMKCAKRAPSRGIGECVEWVGRVKK